LQPGGTPSTRLLGINQAAVDKGVVKGKILFLECPLQAAIAACFVFGLLNLETSVESFAGALNAHRFELGGGLN
jgi:hypothetical protein